MRGERSRVEQCRLSLVVEEAESRLAVVEARLLLHLHLRSQRVAGCGVGAERRRAKNS